MGITRDEELQRIGLAQKEHAIQTMEELLESKPGRDRGELILTFIDSMLGLTMIESSLVFRQGVARGINDATRETEE